MTVDPALVARFAADLDALLAPGEPLGVAVSGGPDSLALLLLAAAARPGLVRAASIDHALRVGSRAEAETVADLCRELGVGHDLLTIAWPTQPASALQERARAARYTALGGWAGAHGLDAVATGHHADDQAETVLMRLMRGAGVRGLAAMRPSAALPGAAQVTLLRPLLSWRRSTLAALVAAAGVQPVDDPSNHDERHERVRVRRLIAEQPAFDSLAIARSARHLAAADEAIAFAAEREWSAVRTVGDALVYRPGAAPAELRRRLLSRFVAALGREGDCTELRGREIDILLDALERQRAVTLRGVAARGRSVAGVEEWHFAPAPARR